MRYQVSGTTWQKVCARIAGSTRGSAVGVSTVPEVPQLATASPGETSPTPTAPQALSAPPPTTGVPTTSPVSLAASRLTVPSTSVLAPSSGKRLMSRSSAFMSGSLQRRFAVSYISVAEASEGSLASTPVKRNRT